MGRKSKKTKNGDGRVAPTIPKRARKAVQFLKEVGNSSTEEEIYIILKECDMDLNRAAEWFLDQDAFHEVKSKRERRNQMKTLDTDGLSHGGKTGSKCNVKQSSSRPVTYNELAEATDKGGSICPSVTSSMNHVVGENMNSDFLSIDKGRQPIVTGVSFSISAEVSLGFEPTKLGVNEGNLSMSNIVRMGKPTKLGVNEGNLSMSNIVRMGKPSQDSVAHCHPKASETSASVKSGSIENQSGQQVFHNEQPSTKQSMVDMSASSDPTGPSDQSNLCGTTANLVRICDTYAAQVSKQDLASDCDKPDKFECSSTSSSHTIVNNPGQLSHSDYNLMTIGSSETHSSLECCEGAGSSSHLSNANHSNTLASESTIDVPSATSDFQQLSISDSKLKVPVSEHNCAVVIPDHCLRAFASECSPLSFGTYNCGSTSYTLASDSVKDVPSAASNFQLLSTNDSKLEVLVSEDNCAVVILDHLLQASASKCSKLDFGTYNCGQNSVSSLETSLVEEKAAAANGSSQNLNASNSVHCGEMQLCDDLTEKVSVVDHESLSSHPKNVLNHIAEETPGSEYPTNSSVPSCSFQNSQQLTPSLPNKRPNLQSRYLSTFPSETITPKPIEPKKVCWARKETERCSMAAMNLMDLEEKVLVCLLEKRGL